MSANERKHVSDKPRRGFALAADHEGRKGLYVRKGWHLERCPGEAHSPEVGGMIDNCTLCAPLWGCIAVSDSEAAGRDAATDIVAAAKPRCEGCFGKGKPPGCIIGTCRECDGTGEARRFAVVDDATANAVADEHIGPELSANDATSLEIAALQHAAEIVARVAQTRDGAHCVVELMRCVARLRGAR